MENDQKKARRDKIVTSLILAAAFVIAVSGLIFGFSQSIEANRNLEKAIASEKQALAAKLEADRQRDIANEQTALLLQREKELEKAKIEVEKVLNDCRKKK
jgi:uncharacterized protein HemX